MDKLDRTSADPRKEINIPITNTVFIYSIGLYANLQALNYRTNGIVTKKSASILITIFQHGCASQDCSSQTHVQSQSSHRLPIEYPQRHYAQTSIFLGQSVIFQAYIQG